MPAITATYYLPRHLARFLSAELGSPYTLRADDNLFSRYMLRTLTGKTITNAHKAVVSPDKVEPFHIIIPPGLNEKNWLWSINPESEKDFVLEAEKIFETVMFSYIQGVMDLKPMYQKRRNHGKDDNLALFQIKTAMDNFCNRYNISDSDISRDALIKRYQRNQGSTAFFTRDRNVEPT